MPTDLLRRVWSLDTAGVLRGVAAALVVLLVATGCSSEDAPRKDDDSSAGTSKETDEGDSEPAPDPGFQAPQAGQCYRLTAAQSRASVVTAPPVACKDQHTTVVAFVGYVPRAVTPRTPVAQRRKLGERLCAPAYRRLVGGTLADRATSILTWTMFTPGQAQLERGARWVRCDVLARSDDRLVPLPPGKPLLAQGIPEQLRVCQTETGADISCGRPHAFRVEAVYREVAQGYPAAPAYTPVARARCQQLMGKFGGFWQPPSREGWQAGDRFIRCLSPAVATGG